MSALKRAWAIRPYPHGRYRMKEFLSSGMAAIGWPAIGDLTGTSRDQIREKLAKHYKYKNSQSLGQKTGIIDRFANMIKVGDAVVIPDGSTAYFGVVTDGYAFKQHLATDDEGYPHWIGVQYKFDNHPILRSELPAVLFDALKGRQSVFGLPPEIVWDIIDNPKRFSPIPPSDQEIELREKYIELLAGGKIPGINSPRFEEAVRKVLSFYFPGLSRLATTNAPIGADTDLKTALPGGIVIRVQVKCYRDDLGKLSSNAVIQLRNSMDDGERGIIVTTNTVSKEARDSADHPQKPISFIEGPEFAQLVFENLDQLGTEDLWALGIRRSLAMR